MKNVCGLSKMFRPTFAPDEKCLRLFEKWSWKNERKNSEIKIERKQLNNHKFQRSEN
jgi:hypothetical protein